MFTPGMIVTIVLWLFACAGLPAIGLMGIGWEVRGQYSSVLQMVTPIISAVLCYRTVFAFERGEDMRKVWFFLGSGVLAWGCGAILYGAYLFINRTEPPYPWYADIGYLTMVPLIVTALLIFKHSLQVKTPFWGLTAGVILFLLTLGLALWSGLGNLEDAKTLTAYLVEIAYIVLDPILLGVTVVSASLLSGGLAAWPWWFGLAGLLFYYLGNIGYDYLVARDIYATGSLVDICWPLGFGLIAVAAMLTANMFRTLDE